MQGQSKNSGLFFEKSNNPYKHTKEAISALQILGLKVKYKTEICKNILDKKEIDINVVSIDKSLNCKKDFKNYKPDFSKIKLVDLYNEGKIMDLLGNSQWTDLYEKLKTFSDEEGKFILAKENKRKSIIATAIGVEMLSLIATKKPNLKNEIIPLLKSSIDSLMDAHYQIDEDMILFLEKNIPSYKVNYHVIKAIKDSKKVGVEIKVLNNNLYKLLNYFNTFKYEMITNVDNTYYLLKIYKLLEKTPLIKINEESFNYLKDKKIKIHFENIFGEVLNIKNSTINILIEEDKDKNPKTTNSNKNTKKKSSYDLEDDETEESKSNLGQTKKEIKINTPKSEVEFDLSEMIKGPGYFKLSINMENKNYGLREHKSKSIRSYSEIKMDSVDFEIIDKIKEENSMHLPVLTSPQRYSQILKANQDCSLIARVKISFPGGQKPTLMEQVFLRLKNIELQKSYNAYASKFDLENNEYFIGFELDDPVNMESYNGVYEASIIMSDPTIKNVLEWDFGQIRISFTKPSDPLDEERALKNKIEPKMEPTFTPEVKREKNFVIASIFSFIILILTFLLLIVLVKSGSNVNNFPQTSFAFLMNCINMALPQVRVLGGKALFPFPSGILRAPCLESREIRPLLLRCCRCQS